MTQPTIGRIVLTDRQVQNFLAHLEPVGEDGCRLWGASLDSDGYGQFRSPPRTLKAHLVAWHLERGDFPEGLEPDHTCNVRHCTTVDHLEWVTHAENNRRIAERALYCRAGLHRWDEHPSASSRHRECHPCRLARRRARYAETGVS